MDDSEFDAELERRLAILLDPDSSDSILEPLPVLDLALAIAGVIILSALVLWWGYLS